MKKLIFTALVLLSLGGGAYAQGVKFEKLTLAEAVAKAAAENKMVFVDCFTEWCGPCKQMDRDVFPKKAAGDFLNPRFVSVKFDMEKGEGVGINKRFAVMAYPTYIILDGKGAEVNRVVGEGTMAEFIARIEKALKPENSADKFRKAYEANKSVATALPYINDMKSKYMDPRPVYVDLWGVLSDAERFSPRVLKLVTEARRNPIPVDYPLIAPLLANRGKYEAVMGKGSMFDFVYEVYQHPWLIAIAGWESDIETLKKSIALVKTFDLPASDPRGHMAAAALLAAQKDVDGLIKYFNTTLSAVPFSFLRSQIEDGLKPLWKTGTPAQKAAIEGYFKNRLKNAKAEPEVAYYTGVVKFFANGGVDTAPKAGPSMVPGAA